MISKFNQIKIHLFIKGAVMSIIKLEGNTKIEWTQNVVLIQE
jgi:hypothetical protein